MHCFALTFLASCFAPMGSGAGYQTNQGYQTPAQQAQMQQAQMQPQAAPQAPAPQLQAGPKVSLRTMLETFPSFTAQQIAYQVTVLTQEEALMLSLFGAVGGAFYRRACEANPGLVAMIGGVPSNCAKMVQDYVQAVQWVGAPAIAQNIETERLHILNTYKCSSGEIDRQTCQQYMGTIQQIQNAQHDTSTTIINNIGNKCRVGVDPGCVP